LSIGVPKSSDASSLAIEFRREKKQCRQPSDGQLTLSSAVTPPYFRPVILMRVAFPADAAFSGIQLITATSLILG